VGVSVGVSDAVGLTVRVGEAVKVGEEVTVHVAVGLGVSVGVVDGSIVGTERMGFTVQAARNPAARRTGAIIRE